MESFRKLYIFTLLILFPLDPGCNFGIMCECENYIYCRKDMLGLGVGAYLEINYKIVKLTFLNTKTINIWTLFSIHIIPYLFA